MSRTDRTQLWRCFRLQNVLLTVLAALLFCQLSYVAINVLPKGSEVEQFEKILREPEIIKTSAADEPDNEGKANNLDGELNDNINNNSALKATKTIPKGNDSTNTKIDENGDDDDDNDKSPVLTTGNKNTAAPHNDRLNIVVFYADDWRHDSIGAVNPIIHTPNLDKLASKGMLFTQNAVTTSICWISRACFATGQHYARHRTKNLSEPVPFYQHWNDTVFAQLKNNGYYTGMVGKWQPGQVPSSGFDFKRSYFGFHISHGKHITDMNERDALMFLQTERKTKAADKPFALFVNFFAPHHHDGEKEQYFPQNKTKHLYTNFTYPFAKTATDEAWKKMPYFFNDNTDARARWRIRFDEPTKAQIMIKNYLRLISGVDMTCGKILEELERQNLINNTMVIFTTDNGYYHAEHGIADKQYAHQESVRVPLIIRDPRIPEKLAGGRNDDLTLSIDLAPTILQAANIEVPARMQGSDMSLLYRSEQKPSWRQRFYYEYPGIFRNPGHFHVQALVRKDYKYIYWPVYKLEELFHLTTDPFEEHDLARDGSFNATMDKMRKEFKEVQAAAK